MLKRVAAIFVLLSAAAVVHAADPAKVLRVATFDIDTLGLGASWTRLLSSCAATKRPAATSSNAPVAPAIPAISADPATTPK